MSVRTGNRVAVVVLTVVIALMAVVAVQASALSSRPIPLAYQTGWDARVGGFGKNTPPLNVWLMPGYKNMLRPGQPFDAYIAVMSATDMPVPQVTIHAMPCTSSGPPLNILATGGYTSNMGPHAPEVFPNRHAATSITWWLFSAPPTQPGPTTKKFGPTILHLRLRAPATKGTFCLQVVGDSTVADGHTPVSIAKWDIE